MSRIFHVSQAPACDCLIGQDVPVDEHAGWCKFAMAVRNAEARRELERDEERRGVMRDA